MKTFSLDWDEPQSLASALQQPLSEVVCVFDRHGRLLWLTLSRSDASALKVASQMIDLEERVEVGVLAVKLVQKTEEVMDKQLMQARVAFERQISSAEKLVIHESGSLLESGLLLRDTTGTEVVILPGVFPCSLTVNGIQGITHHFDPEYPMDRYERLKLF